MDADERSLLEGVLAPRTSGEVPSSRPPPPVALGSTDAPRSRTAVPPVAGSSGTDAGGGGGSGGGGHPRASAGPRSLQPSLWAAVTAGWQPSLRMDLAASAAITASQAMVLAAQWGRARLDERLQPGLVLTGFCLTTYLIACWPTLYWRNRTWVSPLLRGMSIALFPCTHHIGVGTAVMLERPSQPGLNGAVVDALRLATGIRILPLSLFSVFTLLPPTAALALQVAITVATWNSAGYCSTRLLRDPLSRQRQAAFAAFLGHATLPLEAVQPLASQLLPAQRGSDSDALCHATTSFVHLMLGLLVPVLLQIHCWRPGPSSPSKAPGASGATASLARAAQAVARWVAVCDWVLYALAGGGQLLVVRCFIGWYAAANMWLLCQPPPAAAALP